MIEDDPGIAETLGRVLADEGYEVTVERRGDDGLARAGRTAFNVVVTDLKLPGLNGLDLVRQLHRVQPRLPIILMTAFGTTETAIEATKFGAYDYLLKPFDMPELLELVRKAADSNRLMSEPVTLGEAGAARDAIVGQSRAMQAIYKEIGRIAAKPVSVLIRGETGTGKELIARAILPAQRPRQGAVHRRSIAPPSPKRCWKANCSATNAARSPAPSRAASAASSRPTTAPFFSMKSAT